MTKPYTYLIGWSRHNLWYYGVRWAKGCDPADLWVTYFTSSNRVAAKRAELGEPDVVEVRKVFDTGQKARVWEEQVIKRMNCVRAPNWLNAQNGGHTFGQTGPRTPEHAAKISRANKGKERTPEHCHKLSTSNKGKIRTAEHKANVSAAMKGRVGRQWTEEQRKTVSEKRKGVPRSEAFKEKLRQSWATRKALA